jgi:UDP-N-acetylglucosamine--N-acetylmuramyl-(pentapeptide) pyrophosphoryl-undecaprenol N-acetylglucosamine transferase
MLAAAALAGIPLVLQEQNAVPGLVTRWFARWARQVHLGFPEAESFIRPGPATSVFRFGNPIVPPRTAPSREAARARLGIAPDARVVFVFGGSQGARRLNAVVARLVELDRLDDLTLCWSTGENQWADYGRYHEPPRRLVRPFWDPIAEAYRAADVAVARSGAMTTAELCAFGLPAILVPLPTAAANHQTRNAEALAASGAAVHLPEADLGPERLLAVLHQVLDQPECLEAMRKEASRRGRPEAARRIAEAVLGLLS